MTPEKRNIFDVMERADRRWLYLLLVITVSIPLFFPAMIPTVPEDQTKAFYRKMMTADPAKPIAVQSDFTLGTRGENLGQFEALMRILMRRQIKFVLYSGGDPQAPEVARTALRRVNAQIVAEGGPEYKPWRDYVDLGNFTDIEALGMQMAENLRGAWGIRLRPDDQGQLRNVFESPVLQNVQSISDVPIFVCVTASGTIDALVQRISPSTNLMGMVTGVIGPRTLNYYQAGQLKGLVIGLKGGYDLEYMMEHGVNTPVPEGRLGVVDTVNAEPVPPFSGLKNMARAKSYYTALNAGLGLLILAVIVGNVGMFLNRKRGRSR